MLMMCVGWGDHASDQLLLQIDDNMMLSMTSSERGCRNSLLSSIEWTMAK